MRKEERDLRIEDLTLEPTFNSVLCRCSEAVEASNKFFVRSYIAHKQYYYVSNFVFFFITKEYKGNLAQILNL